MPSAFCHQYVLALPSPTILSSALDPSQMHDLRRIVHPHTLINRTAFVNYSSASQGRAYSSTPHQVALPNPRASPSLFTAASMTEDQAAAGTTFPTGDASRQSWQQPRDSTISLPSAEPLDEGMMGNDDEDGASTSSLSRRASSGVAASISRSVDDFSLRRQQQRQQQQLEVNSVVGRGSFSGSLCESSQVGGVQPLPPLRTSSSLAKPQNVASTMAALPRRYE